MYIYFGLVLARFLCWCLYSWYDTLWILFTSYKWIIKETQAVGFDSIFLFLWFTHTHTHTHACTHACTHARTHARTHAHTYIYILIYWIMVKIQPSFKYPEFLVIYFTIFILVATLLYMILSTLLMKETILWFIICLYQFALYITAWYTVRYLLQFLIQKMLVVVKNTAI